MDVHDKNTTWLARRKKFEAILKNPPAINLDTVSQKPQLSFASYCGEFYNPGYGTVKISPYQNGLLLTYEELKLVLISKGVGHAFSSHHIEDNLIYQQWSEGDAVFKTNKNGDVESFSIPFEPEVDPIVFSIKNKSVASKKN